MVETNHSGADTGCWPPDLGIADIEMVSILRESWVVPSLGHVVLREKHALSRCQYTHVLAYESLGNFRLRSLSLPPVLYHPAHAPSKSHLAWCPDYEMYISLVLTIAPPLTSASFCHPCKGMSSLSLSSRVRCCLRDLCTEMTRALYGPFEPAMSSREWPEGSCCSKYPERSFERPVRPAVMARAFSKKVMKSGLMVGRHAARMPMFISTICQTSVARC